MAPVAGSSPCTEPGYSTQARRHWYHIRGGCLGLRRLCRRKSSIACSSQDSQSQGQPAFSAVLRGLDGPFTPVAIGGYKYVSKITGEYTKWTAVYLLTNKNQALQSLQLFVDSTAILSAAASFVGAPTRAASTSGRSFGSVAWRPVLSKSSPPPTCRRKWVCPKMWGELCAP